MVGLIKLSVPCQLSHGVRTPKERVKRVQKMAHGCPLIKIRRLKIKRRKCVEDEECLRPQGHCTLANKLRGIQAASNSQRLLVGRSEYSHI